MDNLPEPANNEQEILTTPGQKIYSTAIRTGVIGGIVSFLFALLAIAALFAGHSDSPGLGFFVFGFLATAVLIISGFIVILISLAGVVNYTALMNRNRDAKEESIEGITKSTGLILGMVLALLVAFKLLGIIW